MMVTGVILALTLAQAPASATPRQTAPQTDETVAVQKGARLNVNNFAGEVIVHTWDKDSVRVLARHQPRTRVSVRPTSGGVAISSNGYMGAPGSVDYDITAPAWMPIRIEGTYNFVTVEGSQAEVYANTVRGDVVIKGGAGVVTAKSVEGEVQVEGARGKVTASSVNEKIKIADSSGDITAETVNGGITMTGIDSKSVDATTVNGTITFEGTLADGGHYAFGTHNGDVVLSLPGTVNATFTVRTYQGSIASEFTLDGYNPRDAQRGRRTVATLGNGSADVNVETFGGAIKLRKGPAARPRGR
jgi:DUF4097 and DUF4098 domain-containing protein YvlB